ncbi:hypothetical protein D9613_001224 [Agrocybe pediades]|uniref:CFEM domain-containing protein n=1 Tax=Agrocybe pediades TaxID=84607 RepID=A0A8H4R1H6_9AGAR|nr:hypothetical protein D9613_001224 [Agrocybe pediades]
MFFATKITFLTAAFLAANAQSVSKNSTSTASATGVAANTTSSAAPPNASGILGSLTPCVLTCVGGAAALNNCSITDTSCVCLSAQFQTDATACLMAHCTPADQAAARQLQTQQCASVGTPTASATTTNSVPFTLASGASGSSTAAGSGTGAPAGSTTPTSPASNSSGAPPSQSSPSAATQLIAFTSPFSLLVAAAGVLAGALVL